ncbi:MAG: hypothetical protein Fur0037_24950 [Planctomycetota bacterium]
MTDTASGSGTLSIADSIPPEIRPAMLAALLIALCPGSCARKSFRDGCPPPDPACPYDLGRPTRVLDLSNELRELSGIALLGDSSAACVQDEKGVLYRIDLADGRILERTKFGPVGDYEGLCWFLGDFWILRSDGLLLRLRPPEKRVAAAGRLKAPVSEYEGITAVPGEAVLLVAPKKYGDLPKKWKHERPLFEFDPSTGKTWPGPVISLEDLALAARRSGVDLPLRGKAGRERADVDLAISGAAACPSGGEIYLVSATEGLLLVMGRGGAILAVRRLDPALLPQAESIGFLPDGTLVIGTEGGNGKARLCFYRRQF